MLNYQRVRHVPLPCLITRRYPLIKLDDRLGYSFQHVSTYFQWLRKRPNPGFWPEDIDQKHGGGAKARKHGRIDQPNIGSYLPKMKIWPGYVGMRGRLSGESLQIQWNLGGLGGLVDEFVAMGEGFHLRGGSGSFFFSFWGGRFWKEWFFYGCWRSDKSELSPVKHCFDIRWMEEILHQLIGGLSHYL